MIGAYDDRLNDQWRQTREVAYMLYCLGTEAKGRLTKQKFMPLNGDDAANSGALSPAERIKATKEKWKQIDERRKNKGK